jgi:putative nucleotidyltransferase with HDIG domain
VSVLFLPRESTGTPPSATNRRNILTDLDRVDTYPTLSETTIRAMAMVNNSDSSAAEVGAIIRRDGVLAAAVLRRANNWMLGGRKAIDNVQQAVVRLGLVECGKLLCMMGVRAMYNRYPQAVQERCDAVHRHSLFVANLAAGLNKAAGLGYGGVEFTSGLLHDIGRIITCVKSPADAPAEPADRNRKSLLQQERELFGVDHCAVGYQFATRNGLPEPLVRVALNHHRPAEERLQPGLVSLIAFANRIANYAQREHKLTGYHLSACPVLPYLARDWTERQEEALRRHLSAVVVQALRDTRAMLKSCA